MSGADAKYRALFGLEFFRDLSADVRDAVVEALSWHRFAAGKRFVSEGEKADRVYFLTAGEVMVSLRETLVTTIEAPTVVGLLSVLDGKPRTASLTAFSNVTAASITGRDLRRLMADHPSVVDAVLGIVTAELRAAFAREDEMHNHLADFFVRPNARIVPGPYVADPFDLYFFVMRDSRERISRLLPRGVFPVPGLAGYYALTCNFFGRVASRHPSGAGAGFPITRPRLSFPAFP